jgi:hypothetical protein
VQRVLTLHVDSKGSLRLTPEIVGVLEAISTSLGSPEMRMRGDGVAIYVNDWDGRI